MTRTTIFATAVLSLLTAPVPVPASESAPPSFRLSDEVVPTGYRVELELDPSREGFSGEVGIGLDLREAVDTLWLHGRELEIVEARFCQPSREGDTGTAREGSEADPEEPSLPPIPTDPACEPVSVETVPGTEQIVGFSLPGDVHPGPGLLEIRYRGTYVTGDSAAIFKQEDGGEDYLFTQFEAIEARQAIPCFDEPRFKVPWKLRLVVPEEDVALSNTPVLHREALGDGRVRVEFGVTEPLPSYLVALAVGPFEPLPAGTVGDTPLRIVALRGKGERAEWAREVTAEILEVHEEYLGIPYPYEKLDSVAIPKTMGFGAMENVGLMTYVERLLLIPPEELTVGRARSYASVAAHEIAHQWFGNYVSPAWWDDIWLNESFATWMGRKVIHRMRPEWEFDVSAVTSASRSMASDTRATATPVVPEIESEHDIETAFSSITYGKGATLLRMFEGWMGEEAFRRGVRSYLRSHAHGNATSFDFLAALDARGPEEVAAAFRTFIDQPGVPLVTVSLECGETDSLRLELAQERLLPVGSKADADLLWTIPVCYRWGGEGSGSGESCVLLSRDRATVSIPATSCPEWLFANAGGRGYYRVRYDDDLLERLHSRATQSLELAERVSMVRDLVELADAGRIPIDHALEVVDALPPDASRHLVSAAATLLWDLEERVPADLEAEYAAFVRTELGALARELGFVPDPDEDPDAGLLRRTVVPLVAEVGEDPELRRRAGELARTWLDDRTAVDPDLAGTVLQIAAEDGDRKLFERFLAEIHRAEERRDRQRLFRALGSFRNPDLRKEAWRLFFEGDFDPYEAVGTLRESFDEPGTREWAWGELRNRFDEITAPLSPQWSSSIPFWVAGFCDMELHREVESFFTGRMEELPGGPRHLDQALESIYLCSASRNLEEAGIRAFFTD